MMDTNHALSQGNKKRAIVIGGGIAGLMVARVLSDYYGEVLIVDRDNFPVAPQNRPGTPQAFQPHRLTPRGNMIMEKLFPGFNDDLLRQGAPSSQHKSVHFVNRYGNMVMQNRNHHATFSRALLEWVFRQRVHKIANVHFLPKHEVVALQTTSDRMAVTGVHIRERETRDQKTLTADIVLDASGRSSKLVKWLQELNFAVPAPDVLQVNLGYSTRHYKVPSHLAEKWDVIRVEGNPDKRSFSEVFSIIENNTAEMLFWSVGGHYPPTAVSDYEHALTRLTSPLMMEVIQGLEPLTSPRGYRISELFRHHFEQMERWPSGLLVLGDAFCNFDPIYGQGMTVAAIEVEILEACLREQQQHPMAGFERRVLQKMQAVVEPAWWLNAVADLQWQGVEYIGAEPLKGITFAQKYMDLYQKHATLQRNWDLYGLYWFVNSLFLSPREIINPEMVTAVLGASDEGNAYLTSLLQEYGQPLDEVLDQIVPSFSDASFVTMDAIN
nr:FAD-dependent monooxygenase [Desmospora activa]